MGDHHLLPFTVEMVANVECSPLPLQYAAIDAVSSVEQSSSEKHANSEHALVIPSFGVTDQKLQKNRIVCVVLANI
jgi:hypothetical protein